MRQPLQFSETTIFFFFLSLKGSWYYLCKTLAWEELKCGGAGGGGLPASDYSIEPLNLFFKNAFKWTHLIKRKKINKEVVTHEKHCANLSLVSLSCLNWVIDVRVTHWVIVTLITLLLEISTHSTFQQWGRSRGNTGRVTWARRLLVSYYIFASFVLQTLCLLINPDSFTSARPVRHLFWSQVIICQ